LVLKQTTKHNKTKKIGL